MKIPCTIGVLTYNSGEGLRRALASVEDFAEIIIADGGSTDDTLAIAASFHARVIPQSQQGAITNFARERNLLLDAATEPWFFYLDPDESMSGELRDVIAQISRDENSLPAYRVRYVKTNEDITKKYRTYREYYQVRLVRTDIGAHFERPVHERLVVPQHLAVGQIEAPWYVPLDRDDLSFRIFAGKAWLRTGIQARIWEPKGALDVLRRVLLIPLTLIAKSFYKIVVVKLTYGSAAIPMRYELLRVLYACCMAVRHAGRVLDRLGSTRKV
jgi:glycosyltransferase involved in cell wall biosynthesis